MPEQNSSISNFKRFLMWVLLPLILVVSGAGIVFNYFFEKKIILNSQICGAYKVNRIINETHAAEIPIFGSSRADGGFIPDSLGRNYFNYGLSGSKYDATLFFVEEECKKIKSVPWILLNFDLEGLSYGLGNIANYIPNSNYAPVRSLMGSNYKFYYSLPFVKYYGLYEKYASDYINDKINLTKFSDKGASIEKKVLTAQQFNELVERRRNSPTKFTNDPVLEQRLFNIIQQHPGRFFIFVVSPYHSSYFEKYVNIGDARAFLDKLGTFKNVKVYDFGQMALPDSLFFNTSHLNYKGAAVFNKQLRDSLAALGVH